MVHQETPLFCVETIDNVSGLPLFINFYGTNEIQYPAVDLHEDMLMSGIMRLDNILESWTLPVNLGPLYWKISRELDTDHRSKGYVIDTKLNHDFAIRRIIMSEVVRHYVITVALSAIEKKFNDKAEPKKYGQFIGHDLDLDVGGYKVVDSKSMSFKSNELVNNKVTPLGLAGNTLKNECDTNETDYSLFYRPRSKILTCVLSCDTLPTSIGYSDDRIVVNIEEKSLMDIYLPFFINLKEPMKYKFDDRSCTIKIVFKIIEKPNITKLSDFDMLDTKN